MGKDKFGYFEGIDCKAPSGSLEMGIDKGRKQICDYEMAFAFLSVIMGRKSQTSFMDPDTLYRDCKRKIRDEQL